jgi:hypothetical protein
VLLATASGHDRDIRLEERTHGRGAIAGAAGPIHREQFSFRAP